MIQLFECGDSRAQFFVSRKKPAVHKHDRSRLKGMKRRIVKENQTRLYSFFKRLPLRAQKNEDVKVFSPLKGSSVGIY